jgi:drug/metabolite transporter (DMT)-like permease
MILFLIIIIALFQGIKTLGGLGRLFLQYWKFWVITGSIGFGGFYSLICFSASYAPGWVIATTWQITIMATLLVLSGFGQTFPKRVWFFSLIVLCGVLMVNLSQAETFDGKTLLTGSVPVLLAAFCYPIGNQLLWEARNGHRLLPHIENPLLDNPFNKVLLLSIGSIPFWLILLAATTPPPPSQGQLARTALVALFSGVFATSLFLFARSRATRASELAAVDATQSSEVIFAILGEIIFLNSPLPNAIAWAGIVLVFTGLILFIRFKEIEAT